MPFSPAFADIGKVLQAEFMLEKCIVRRKDRGYFRDA